VRGAQPSARPGGVRGALAGGSGCSGSRGRWFAASGRGDAAGEAAWLRQGQSEKSVSRAQGSEADVRIVEGGCLLGGVKAEGNRGSVAAVGTTPRSSSVGLLQGWVGQTSSSRGSG